MKIKYRLLILAVTAGLSAAVPIGNAQAREPVPFEPRTLNGCGFPISVEAVSNGEFQDVITLADGTTITRIRGKLKLSFTNKDTGFTITRNVSGPTTETDRPDGTAVFVAEGENWFGFGPRSQANTGEPGLVFTKGLVVLEINGAVTSFSLKGTQENGCDLLRG